jgi:hypothetical protein
VENCQARMNKDENKKEAETEVKKWLKKIKAIK